MVRFLIFILIMYLLTLTPFYKKEILPYYERFSASVSKMLDVHPSYLKDKKFDTSASQPSQPQTTRSSESPSQSSSDNFGLPAHSGTTQKSASSGVAYKKQ